MPAAVVAPGAGIGRSGEAKAHANQFNLEGLSERLFKA